MTLHTQGLQSLEQVRAFLEGSQPLDFEVPNREATYEFIAQNLRLFGYARLGKADKDLLRRYLCKVTDCVFRTISLGAWADRILTQQTTQVFGSRANVRCQAGLDIAQTAQQRVEVELIVFQHRQRHGQLGPAAAGKGAGDMLAVMRNNLPRQLPKSALSSVGMCVSS